jgi:dipeptidyl aminopeptidase/acylaminoacyl peptidase
MKKNIIIFMLFLTTCIAKGIASEQHVISNWLKTGTHTFNMPVFHQDKNTEGDVFKMSDLLNTDQIDFSGHFPSEDENIGSFNGTTLIWAKSISDSKGYIFPEEITENQKPQAAYLAVYLNADRFIKTTLEIKSAHMLRVWLNGESVGSKTTVEQEENTVGKVSKELTLTRGKHLLLIKTLKTADANLPWKIMASLEINEPYTISDLAIETHPTTRKNIDHILEGVKISSIQPSQDAKFYLVNYSRALPSDQSERWSEIRQTTDRKLIHSFRHARISQLKWLPNSNRLSYIASSGGKSSLFLFDFANGEIIELIKDIEKLSGYTWAPNEQFIIYSITEQGSSTDTDIRQVLGMQDRMDSFRDRSFLYHFDVNSGYHQRLTFGNLTTSLQDISPDSESIVFSQSYPDYTQRPFSAQNMFILDIENHSLDTLWMDEPWSLSVQFSPDGQKLLATGSAESFGGIGKNVPANMIVNTSDTQGFIYDLTTRKAKAFTRNFNPSLSSVDWHAPDNMIYMVTTDKDFRSLYRYHPEKQQTEKVELGVDYLRSFSLARNARSAIASASQTNQPEKHFTVNLRNLKTEVIENTEEKIYQHVEFGEVKDWNFNTSAGQEIIGRVYYPPGFDEEKTYPAIVYYYAGTTPVGRTFGGRYPFNLWAGNDYIVYVLQPSGAIGFGQEFSAAHVNNWGATVADEIIEGTKKFLDAHAFVNKEKVGCAGASYGGFMTMLLMTRTDIFAAAISHAGISSISSYWGEGYWGYAYSSSASANSYPWNNKDLYIEQSPLFHADKINTPLLLLTGDSDTNVPPGESIQLYTALRILNRPVELVMVKDQDHHILAASKRRQWNNVIMAWWDKHLKDQHEWWEEQFPENNY